MCAEAGAGVCVRACMCTCHKCSGTLAEVTELSCSIPLLYSPETGARVVADKPRGPPVSACTLTVLVLETCVLPHLTCVLHGVLVLVQQALSPTEPSP